MINCKKYLIKNRIPDLTGILREFYTVAESRGKVESLCFESSCTPKKRIQLLYKNEKAENKRFRLFGDPYEN